MGENSVLDEMSALMLKFKGNIEVFFVNMMQKLKIKTFFHPTVAKLLLCG